MDIVCFVFFLGRRCVINVSGRRIKFSFYWDCLLFSLLIFFILFSFIMYRVKENIKGNPWLLLIVVDLLCST